MNRPEIDYKYIAENMSELSRIPVRVYRNREQTGFFSPIPFPVDPAVLYLDKILSIEKSISYYITPYYEYYGIVCHEVQSEHGQNQTERYTFVIGPTSQIPHSRSTARELMFLLGIAEKNREAYQNMLRSITPMPLHLFLHFLCLLNYYLNDEKKNMAEILLFDSSSDVSLKELREAENLAVCYDTDLPDNTIHTSIEFENQMTDLIRNGDPEGLNTLFSHVSPGQAGKIGDNYLRQLKNIFIVSATLSSRAAIAGGLPAEEALSLSDDYIRHSEKYTSPEPINHLQYHMVLDFAGRVQELTPGKDYSKAVRDTISFIRDRLTENVSIEQLAEHAYLSRSQLSVRFRRETGMTITEYTHQLKIRKAREFLTSTAKTPLEISTYLGFSSQSHFQKVFKNITGMTPKEYRETHRGK